MKLEHIALDVAEPEAFITWWCENLGFRRSFPELPFIMDESGTTGLEIYRSAETPQAPDYWRMKGATLHVAFVSEDVRRDAERLVAAGAVLEKLDVAHEDFQLAVLRDPWGVTIQFCRRARGLFLPAVKAPA